jgi:hypothetical protein
MMSCKEVAEFVTRSFETRLPFWQRVQLVFHLCGCRWCRRFRDQLRVVKQACRLWSRSDRTSDAAGNAALSAEARARIRRALRHVPPEDPQ